jgi:hypothetical protein
MIAILYIYEGDASTFITIDSYFTYEKSKYCAFYCNNLLHNTLADD